MKSSPPKCSREWTCEERQRLAAWIVSIGLDCIRRDDPAMPILAKRPVFEVLRALNAVLTGSADVLEENRAALEKPYDSEKDYHSIWVAKQGG